MNNPDLLKKWLDNISRENFTPSKHSRLCSKHFEQSCLKTKSNDSNSFRKRKRDSLDLAHIFLEEDAAPTIFSGLPTHMMPKKTVKRSSSATSSGRLDSFNSNLQKRDIFRDVMRSSEDWKLNFLSRFS